MKAEKVYFQLNDYDVKAWYILDHFNQRLIVGICSTTRKELHFYYHEDAITDAYDHYNNLNKDNQLIHPAAL